MSGASMNDGRHASGPTPFDGGRRGRTERVRAIDLLRGLAVVVMIAVHLCDAFLPDRYRSHDLWHWVNILFGFVAPAFLFLSGVMTSWAVARRRRDDRSPSDLIVRGFALLLVGFWLQLPSYSLRTILTLPDADALRAVDMNVLQVIGIGMILLILLATVRKSSRISSVVLGSLALIIAAATPWVSSFTVDEPVLSLLIGPDGSFPLSPNLGYVVAGCAAGPIIATMMRKRYSLQLMLAGGAVVILTQLWRMALPGDSFWEPGLPVVLFRLGGVVMAVGMVGAIVDRWVRIGSGLEERRRTVLERIGSMSLGIYVVHLIIIYGSPMSIGLRAAFGGRFAGAIEPMVLLLLWPIVTLLGFWIVERWNAVGQRNPRLHRRLIWGWWIVVAEALLLG